MPCESMSHSPARCAREPCVFPETAATMLIRFSIVAQVIRAWKSRALELDRYPVNLARIDTFHQVGFDFADRFGQIDGDQPRRGARRDHAEVGEAQGVGTYPGR